MNEMTAQSGASSALTATSRRTASALLGLSFLTALAFLWLPPMRSSLWLDELGTYWVIKDGWADALHRGYEFHGQPLYYSITWATRHLFGTSELGLRIPSFLAMAGAAYLVYRIGRRQWDAQTGGVAAAFFVASRDVAFEAVDVRPYALLYLIASGATLVLIRWLDEGKPRDAVCYVLMAALLLQVHLLAFPVLLAHAAYALWRTSGLKSRRRALFLIAIAVVASLVTDIASFLWFASRRGEFSFAGPPRLEVLLEFLLLPLFISAATLLLKKLDTNGRAAFETRGRMVLALALLLFPPLVLFFASSFSSTLRIFFPRYFGIAAIGAGLVIAAGLRRLQPRALVPAVALLLFPPLVLFFASSFSSSLRIFFPRYFAIAAIGAGLVIAAALRRLQSRALVPALALAFTVVSVAAGIPTEHVDADWRAAAALERTRAKAETPLLIQAGYVEGVHLDWLEDRERSDYLLAPVSYYRFDGAARPLPLVLDASGRDYLERLMRTTLADAPEFVVVTSAPDVVTQWFEDHASSIGVRLREYRTFGLVSVAHFARQL